MEGEALVVGEALVEGEAPPEPGTGTAIAAALRLRLAGSSPSKLLEPPALRFQLEGEAPPEPFRVGKFRIGSRNSDLRVTPIW